MYIYIYAEYTMKHIITTTLKCNKLTTNIRVKSNIKYKRPA